jgi:hypothetical protein
MPDPMIAIEPCLVVAVSGRSVEEPKGLVGILNVKGTHTEDDKTGHGGAGKNRTPLGHPENLFILHCSRA